MGCEIGRIRPTSVFERAGESPMTPPASSRHCQVNESGTYEGRRIRDQAAVTAVHTVNARARNIRC